MREVQTDQVFRLNNCVGIYYTYTYDHLGIDYLITIHTTAKSRNSAHLRRKFRAFRDTSNELGMIVNEHFKNNCNVLPSCTDIDKNKF